MLHITKLGLIAGALAAALAVGACGGGDTQRAGGKPAGTTKVLQARERQRLDRRAAALHRPGREGLERPPAHRAGQQLAQGRDALRDGAHPRRQGRQGRPRLGRQPRAGRRRREVLRTTARAVAHRLLRAPGPGPRGRRRRAHAGRPRAHRTGRRRRAARPAPVPAARPRGRRPCRHRRPEDRLLRLTAPEGGADRARSRAGRHPLGRVHQRPQRRRRCTRARSHGNGYLDTAKYTVADTPLWPRPFVVFADNKTWTSLPEADRDLITQAAEQARTGMLVAAARTRTDGDRGHVQGGRPHGQPRR